MAKKFFSPLSKFLCVFNFLCKTERKMTLMQLEITNATQKCKTEYKYANRNIKMIRKTRTKQNKMIVGKDG